MVEGIGEACGFAIDCKEGARGLQLRCVWDGVEASQAATAQLVVRTAVGCLAFQARGGLCRRHEMCLCACSCAHVLRPCACWLAKQGMQGWATAQQSACRCAGAVQGLEARGKFGALRCKVIKEVGIL